MLVFVYKVRAIGFHVDGEEETGRFVFVAQGSIRASCRRLLHFFAFRHHYGFSQRVLRPPTTPGNPPPSPTKSPVFSMRFFSRFSVLNLFSGDNNLKKEEKNPHVWSNASHVLLRGVVFLCQSLFDSENYPLFTAPCYK